MALVTKDCSSIFTDCEFNSSKAKNPDQCIIHRNLYNFYLPNNAVATKNDCLYLS